MKLNQLKTVQVEAKTLKLHLKVGDQFTVQLMADDGGLLFDHDDGYVPDFMPEKHYGDYVILDIDIDTGKITNWQVPTAGQLEEWMSGDDDD